ncbi:MAG: SDR family oxidoreductase [Candidatus Izemoplasmatales bacterium]|jgi:short-subunit dehydrogenase|nr:SDR family oxidoreductase [Candidatus Izemoplasmatales bacterium]
MNKTVVISGASSGIGFATAEYLDNLGYNVIGLSRKYPTNEYKFKYYLCDITKEDQIIKLVENLKQDNGSIDVLVNCAGMGVSGAIEYSSEKEFRKIFDVNVMGQFLLTKNLIPLLRKSNNAKIINIGSVAGELIIPFQTFYSMTKAAIHAFSEGLRNELRPFNIQVVSVLPGDIKTDFTKNREMPLVLEDDVYNDRIKKSLARMAKDEENGMPALSVAKVIKKLIDKRRVPVAKTVGFQYKLFVFLQRIFPKSFVNWIIKKMYG